MRGSILGVLLLVLMATVAVAQKSMKADLVFLTRDGCVNTPDMVKQP